MAENFAVWPPVFHPAEPKQLCAKLMASVSLLVWIAAIFCRRGIAYAI